MGDCQNVAKYSPQVLRKFVLKKFTANPTLNALIYEEQDVLKAFLKYLAEASEANQALQAWAASEDALLSGPINKLVESQSKLNEFATEWSEEHKAYVAQIALILSEVKATQSQQKVVDTKTKEVAAAEKAIQKAKDKVTNFNAGGKISKDQLQREVTEKETERDQKVKALADAQKLLAEQNLEVTNTKNTHIKAGLLRLTQGYLKMHQQSAKLMEEQLAIIEAIPGEITAEMMEAGSTDVGGSNGSDPTPSSDNAGAASPAAASPAAQDNGSALASASSALSGASKNAAKSVEGLADDAVKSAKSAAADADKVANDAADAANEAADDATDAANDAADDATNAANNAVANAHDAANDAADSASDAVNNAAESIEDDIPKEINEVTTPDSVKDGVSSPNATGVYPTETTA